MANELLDFVMSLVRDPEVAARYAADPDRALAGAGLTGVTSADVNNLLPLVSDSLAMTGPPVGAAGSAEGNIWTGGAATAAFDAFTPLHQAPPVTAHQPVIDAPDTFGPTPADPWFGTDTQVTADSPAPAPVNETDFDTPPAWAGGEQLIGDSHTPFEHHVIDDPGFSGFELLD